MIKNIVSSYNSSLFKKLFNQGFALICLITLLPLYIFIAILAKLFENGPVLFIQDRIGKNGKVFKMIKFRTMRVGAEEERGDKSLERQNMSDGPVFKIKNDPRLTTFGKYLSKSGLDELPQIINVIKGEMSFVGPRPLPVYEANKLTKHQKLRELVLPGITSSWVINGAHRLKFKEWMDLDKDYVENADFLTDASILVKTALLISIISLKKLSKVLKPR